MSSACPWLTKSGTSPEGGWYSSGLNSMFERRAAVFQDNGLVLKVTRASLPTYNELLGDDHVIWVNIRA